MKKYGKVVVALSLTALGVGCNDFLAGEGLTENPNSPVEGTALQQLIAVQANMFTRLEGQLARNAGMYTQQIIGSNNQQLTWGTQYGITEGDIAGQQNAFYTGGGLVGIRNVQQAGRDAGDPLIEGIGKIWEGFAFGTAASLWGDVAYSEALNPAILTPKLDSQESVYAAVQTVLDEGIALLGTAPTTGNCDPADLIYCASTTTRALQISRWVAAANTLKARFHLHLVERNGNAAYTAALAAAQAGIAEVPATASAAMNGQGAGDFRAFHGATIDLDANIWTAFLNSRQDLVAGNALVALLKARNDPRLTQYFNNNASGVVTGADQNNVAVGTGAPSVINTTVRRTNTFRQPFITWAENELILAEAKFQLQGAAAALPHVNNVRTAVGLGQLASVTFTDVMNEKYIAMFQNVDVWSDYKRTCIPAVTPFGTAAEVPGRLPYSSTERNANPNIPLPSAYPAGTTGVSALRNWNDPNPCPRP
jgi:hypothetical protein